MRRSIRSLSLSVSLSLTLPFFGCRPARHAHGPSPIPSLAYIERTTAGARASDALPMVVALHGMGDRPERAFETMYAGLSVPARVILPRAPIVWGAGFSWFAFRAGERDDAALATALADDADRIDALVARLVHERPTRGRPVVVGFSQGGMLSYAIALRHGARYAGAVPMAGYVPAAMVTEAACARAPELLRIHGEADGVVPFAWEVETTAALERSRCRAHMTSFAGLGHTSSPALLQALDDAVARALSQR